MTRKYFTLVVREDRDSFWHPQFGDYDRAVVVQEQADTYACDFTARNMKIISSGDTKAEIDAAILKLNS